MEVTLTDDQEFFRETTRKFLESECPIVKVRELAASPDGFERDYWRQGAELGWTSLLVPEDLGGGSISGSGVVDLTLVADAFGSHAAPGPLLPANVVAAAIARAGTDDQKAGVLPALVGGEVVAAWAVAEPAPHDRLGDVTVTATADGGDFVLSGVKSPVEAGAQSEQLLVTARAADGLAQFLVPADTSGVTVTPLNSLDLVRRYARVELDGVRVPAAAAVGVPGRSDADVERQLQLAIVIQAAESVGAAQTVFDFTLDWAFSRYSFGRPLASYQELKHRFADMKMWLEASHALASAAAREVQAEAAGVEETVSATKAYTGDYLTELVQDCVQMHGGIGVTYDHDIHLYLRRVTVDRLTHGTPADHRQRIAAQREAAA
jgi:alkylation response protein AidB-like acyl-CoA dehydrogenase